MRDRLWEGIKKVIPGTEVYGCIENRLPNTLNCGFEGANGESLLIALDMEGVSVSTGSACSSGSGLPSPALLAMQLPISKINSSLRFSLGWGNTFDDIDLVVKILAKAILVNKANSFNSI
jgi:cysteine desulfurase